MKAEWVLYFSHVEYMPMRKEVGVIEDTPEECLFNIFDFISCDVDGNDGRSINRRNIQEIQEKLFTDEDLKWVLENDVLDWKKCLSHDINNAIRHFNKLSVQVPAQKHKFHSSYIMRVLQAYCGINPNILEQNQQNNVSGMDTNVTNPIDGFTDTIVKSPDVKIYVDAIAHLISPGYFQKNEDCEIDFPLNVKLTDVVESSLVEDRNLKIIVKPDGVFTCPIKEVPVGYKDAAWKLVVEIFGSYVSTLRKNLPGRLNVTDQAYVHHAGRYIECSLPQQCCSFHCVDKMAGQHVMQLFAEASQNCCFSGTEKQSQRAIGLFCINEYIYFSRLDVENQMLSMIKGERCGNSKVLNNSLDDWFETMKPPTVRYANFRLDITKPNHRMALLLFLTEYLSENEKYM